MIAMNAHALAAVTTREPDDDSREEWIAYCVAIQFAWRSLDRAVREELEGER